MLFISVSHLMITLISSDLFGVGVDGARSLQLQKRKKNSKMANGTDTTHIKSLKISSRLRCSIYCGQTTGCNAFNFDLLTSQCDLISNTAKVYGCQLHEESKTEFYQVKPPEFTSDRDVITEPSSASANEFDANVPWPVDCNPDLGCSDRFLVAIDNGFYRLTMGYWHISCGRFYNDMRLDHGKSISLYVVDKKSKSGECPMNTIITAIHDSNHENPSYVKCTPISGYEVNYEDCSGGSSQGKREIACPSSTKKKYAMTSFWRKKTSWGQHVMNYRCCALV